MNWFKLYIGDYQRDTAHLSITEHGAYLLMLQHYYATEKPLPTGKALHRMLRAQDKAERDAIDAVAAQFWTTTSDGLVNGRADDEITKAGAQADTNARIAREREAKRKAERDEHERSTNRATKAQPNQTPDTRHQTPEEKTSGGEPPEPPAARKRPAPAALPPWVDADAWAGFEAMRKASRKPLTDAARSLAVAELARLRDAGQDPTEVLRQSTFRSWAGLFPVKSDDHPRPGGPRVVGAMSEHGLQTMRNAQALERRLFGDAEVSDAA